ncbi:MAG: amidohydrolase [Deltaproteobacteria bacterium]|nr:amidohydrolase [Deltaproteobacteria bacterium]
MARDYQLVSADSHVLEPPHIWTTYMEKRFHSKVPTVVPDGEGGEAWQFGPGTAPAPIGIYASAGRAHDDIRWTGVTFAAANQGNFRGEPRLDEQDQDGVDAEVLFGSARMMSHFYSDEDPEFHLAGVRAYNDWLAQEIVSVDPTRLVGLACLPALGVEAAIAEMERCLKLGFRGVWLNTLPSVGDRVRPEDDRFWEAAQANRVPVHFHVRIMKSIQKPKPKGVRGGDLTGLASVGAADMIVQLSEIIESGVHDRFPDLAWVMVEAGSGWLPYLLEQLDDRWERNRSWLPVKLRHKPSEYYRRNWLSTFMIDHYAVKNRHALGVGNLMWSSDYPHHGCDWPRSRAVVDEMFEGVPADERRKMCAGNAVRLYGLA